VVPLTLEELQKKDTSSTGFLVMWDELGVGYGDIVALSEGGEAAQPFRPELKPVDAYNAAILDELDVS
jgi:ethanolamine utilization protein EutN